jgi:subtilisin family serine protease
MVLWNTTLTADDGNAFQEEKVVELGGEHVKLLISNTELFMRPASTQWDRVSRDPQLLAANARMAQESVTNTTMPSNIFRGSVDRLGSFPGGIVVARAPALKSTQLHGLVAQYGCTAQPVLLYNGRRVLIQGTVTVRFKSTPKQETLAAISHRFRMVQTGTPKYASNLVRFRTNLDGSDPLTASDMLNSHPAVEWAEPDLVYEGKFCGALAQVVPNDTFFDKQFYLTKIGMSQAWALADPSSDVTVAVLDDGVDLTHPDLQDRIVAGYNYVDQNTIPQPAKVDAHGTACAGIIGAIANNNLGIAGVAKCKIMPLRICGPSGYMSDAEIANAFDFASTNGAKIISCSWGGGPPSRKITNAIDSAVANGALVFAAAGNAIPAMPVYFPARYSKCIAVGAMKRDDVLWNYSCYGPDKEVDLVAPSGDINLHGDVWTTDHQRENGYNKGGPSGDEPTGDFTGRFGGTSAATPLVAGVAAWLWTVKPHLSAAQIRAALEQSAKKVDQEFGAYGTDGKSKFYGFGMVDPVAAYQAAPIAQAEGRPVALSGKAALPVALPISYRVGEESVTLKPDPAFYALAFLSGGKATKPLTMDGVSARLKKVPILENNACIPVENGCLIVVSKGLADSPDLTKQVKEAGLSYRIEPVFRATNDPQSLLLLSGTVSCQPIDEGSVKKIEEFAKRLGLLVRRNGKLITVSNSLKKDAHLTVSRTMEFLQHLKGVAWAEPDLLRESFKDVERGGGYEAKRAD